MITIIGPGSLGLFFAAKFWQKCRDVYILDYKEERARLINEKGISLKEQGKIQKAYPQASTDPLKLGKQKYILILVKSFQTKAILKNLVKLCDSNTLVLTLQNGIGAGDILSEVISADNLALGVTMHGANKKNDTTVIHAGEGDTIIGKINDHEVDSRLLDICKLFQESGLTCKVVEDILPFLWKKLIVNVGINPITALCGIRNGAILKDKRLLELQSILVYEAYKVMEKQGVDIGLDKGQILEFVKKVCKDTSENISSMLQDRLCKKETEIDFINGAIVKMGKALGIETPANMIMNNMIKFFTSVGWSFENLSLDFFGLHT